MGGDLVLVKRNIFRKKREGEFVTGNQSFIHGRVSALGRRWEIRDTEDYSHVDTVDGPSRIQGQIAFARGCGPQDMPGLLNPALSVHMPDPFVLTDMEKAAKRLANAVLNNETILIFGDYDVDGATSTAIVQKYLKMAKARAVITHVPDRDNGYGFGDANCEEAIAAFPDLIILLDCGTQNHETIARARATGADVIVVDHHQPSDTLPEANALINPHRHDETDAGVELRNLCTAGLAFMLVTATNRELRAAGRFDRSNEPVLASLLDLVALGTVCDVMKLTGLNRSFVSLGLKRLDRRDNKGLQALARVAGVKEGATATALGFHLGPRINAGGRIGKARLGADLLASDDETFCIEIASQLNDLNLERRAIENAVLQEATELVNPDDRIIIVAKEGWHHGVIGIVAGRLKETFNRPVIVIGIDENGVGKGSGRSIVGVDLGKAVMDAVKAGHLVAGGGHQMACGLTIDPTALDAFRSFMNDEIGASCETARDANASRFDAFVYTSDLTPGFVNEIEQMGPYGQGWPKPRFILGPGKIENVKELRGGHVKFTLIDSNGTVDAMAFRAAETGLMDAIMSNSKVLVGGQADLNTWQGMTRLQFLVDDIMVIDAPDKTVAPSPAKPALPAF